jgi:hypothetical protein
MWRILAARNALRHAGFRRFFALSDIEHPALSACGQRPASAQENQHKLGTFGGWHNPCKWRAHLHLFAKK